MFWTRLASGIVLLIIAIGTFALGGPVLAALLFVISLVGYRELTKALQVNGETGNKKFNGPELVGFAGILLYYAAIYFTWDNTYPFIALVVTFLAEMFLYVIRFPRYRAEQIAAAVFAYLYGPVMLSFIYLTRETQLGIYMVWLILISSWGCDTCAYAVGKAIGKKKIFPVLSPHKSLEGCIGGVLGAALIGGIYAHFVVAEAFPVAGGVWIVALISAAGAVMSMVGDLAASAIKRNHDIKDYGHLIPGHGGIMDRFDSVIVTAPIVYILTVLILN